MGSYRDADTYYRRALEYFPADDPWRPEAELGHVICVMSQADASVDLEAHLVKLTQTGQTDFRRRALHVLGVWRRTQGRYAAAMEVLDTTLSLGGPSVDMQFISSQTEMMLCYLLIGENAKAKTILRDLWPHVKYAHPIDVAALTTAALALQVRLGEGVAIPCFTDYEGRWEALVNWAWRKHGLTERYDPLP